MASVRPPSPARSAISLLHANGTLLAPRTGVFAVVPTVLGLVAAMTGLSAVPALDPRAVTCEGIELKIVTEASDPEASLATLVTSEATGARMVRTGEELGGARVVFIGDNRARSSPAVWLETPASVCQALLFEPPAKRLANPPADPESPVERAPQALGPSRLRIVPDFENGVVVGIRLFGIRRDGLFAMLGFENGDRIESINDFPISTPERALEAYARLRSASHLRVKLIRHGHPLTLDFHID